MLILAIDTSDQVCSIAIGTDGQMLAEYHFHGKMTLLRRLIPNIHCVLADSGHSVRDLTGVVAAIGPGSFTGLRIGVTTAKSLAHTLRIPIVGVGTLDALAFSYAPSAQEVICPMIHARSGEVYWSVFDSTGDVRLTDPEAGTVASALDGVALRANTAFFCGSGAVKNAETIRRKFGSRAVVGPCWTSFTRGAALLQKGEQLLRDGVSDDPLSLVPLYIRKPTPVLRLEGSD